MGVKKNRLKRGLVLALTLALVGNGMSSTVLTALAEDEGEKLVTTETQGAMDEQNANPIESEEGVKEPKLGPGDMAGISDTSDGKINEAIEEKTIPVEEDALPDNDELFAGYVDQLFFGELNGDISLFGDFGKKKLTGINIDFYNTLKAAIAEVAAGTRTSTAILCSIAWSAEDLGLVNATGQQIYDTGYQKFQSEYDSKSILDYLLMDCPYELYWFDKTKGMRTSIASRYDPMDQKIHIDLTFSFTVAEGYQGDSFQVDAAKAQSTLLAVQTAKDIVAKYKDKSDYEKLVGYRKEICDLVSYNNEAADSATKPSYGNPWQLIWVFDQDANTEVVCEGYSKAFQYLCDLSQFTGDVACYTVSGVMSGGTGAGPHMWNIVTLGGKNYLVDVTNCDTGSVGADDKLFLVGTTGSVTTGYTFSIIYGNASVYHVGYTYDKDQVGLFGESILSLASENYVEKDKLIIKEPSPVSVVYGTTVDSSVLINGSATNKQGASVAGTFEWSDAVNISGYGNVGTKTLQAVFIPADTNRYSEEMVSVSVTVNRKPIEVRANSLEKTYGDADPVLTYTTTPEVNLSGELSRVSGEDAGKYVILQGGLTDINNPNYQITFNGSTLTINKASVRDNTNPEQNVLQGVGEFSKPTFTGVKNDEDLNGDVSYSCEGNSGLSYEDLRKILAELPKDTEKTIGYSFVPSNSNYLPAQGEIKITVKDIEFIIGNQDVTIDNAVTIKDTPTYGDNWSDIVKINDEIVARAGGQSDDNKNRFTLSVSGTPKAGENQEFKVLYNGTLGGKEYKDAEVCKGTVTIAKRTLTVDTGDYKVTKEYDGMKNGGESSGNLNISGRLESDKAVTVVPSIVEYADENVGTTAMEVGLVLSGDGSENYVLGNTTIKVPYEITPKQVVPVVNVADISYNKGEKVEPQVTVTVDDRVLTGEEYRVSYSDNENVGTGTVSVSSIANGNYIWETVNQTFNIVKADYAGKMEDVISTKYGNTDTVDLKVFLQEGADIEAVFGNPVVAGDMSIFDELPSIDDAKVLSYKLANNSKNVNSEAVITIPVETRNYNTFNITITVKVTEKSTQENFGFDVKEDVQKVYGDSDFVIAAKGAAAGSAVTYVSSNPAVATVDATSGNVHILKKGSVIISATAAETDEYTSATDTYTLTVSPKALTWDVSGLQAVNKAGTIEDNKASLYGALRVSGILSADSAKVTFDCPAEKLTGTYAKTTAGSQKVTLAWADGEAVTLTGTDADNYTLPSALPEITGKINAVSEVTNVPESTDSVKYKFEVEDGISQVPDALKDNPDLNTPAKIEEKMKYEIRAKLTGESNQNSVEVYDVVLMVKNGDEKWVVATPDNFPSSGVTVTLPYPEGTGKDTHDFEVAHMFTHSLNGHKAGDIEYPTPTKVDEGIQFKVTSLSPVSIGWKEIKREPVKGDNTNNTTTPDKKTSPQTGDENAIMLYVLLMMLGAVGIGFTMKRKTTR